MPPATQTNPALLDNPRETLRQVASRARELQPTVSANALTTPPPPVTVPEPSRFTIPTRSGAMVNNVLGSIRSTSERAQQLEENNAMIGNFVDQSSGFDLQQEQLNRFGVTPERLAQLNEIELQLAGNAESSAMTQLNIQGAAGQTLQQGGREVTQQQREESVRSMGLAAQAAVLQNNINLGRELARDAVTVALADRDFKYKNLIQQNQQLQGQVDEETRQLLQAEQRVYEEALAQDEELKRNVESAVISGAASQEEIAQLNALLPTHPDPEIEEQLQQAAIADKNALARSIVGRGAGEMRNLQIRQAESSLATDAAQRANIYDQIASRQVAIREAAQEAATEEEAKQLEIQAETEQALELRTLAEELKTMSGLGAAVGFGFGKSVRGSIPFIGGGAISGTSRADFEALAERTANLLTLDNLDLMSGVLSETDIKILESSGSNLRNFSQSEDQYLEEVERIINVMNRTIDNNGLTPEQAVFWGALEETDVNTFNSLWETL